MMFGLCPRFVFVDDVRVSIGDIFGLSHGFNEVRGIAGVNQAMLKNQKAHRPTPVIFHTNDLIHISRK